MVTDSDGTIRYMSPSVERVLGYRPEEMVGTNTADYVHPDDMERAFRELEALLSKPGVHPVTVETRVRHKDGSWRHLEGIATNLLGDPAVSGLVFNHRDVTDRVRAEEEVRRLNEELEARVAERTARLEDALAELRESEERFRFLVEGATDYAIFMLDPEGRITTWNEGAERLFGYTEEEIIGESGSILFTPEDIRSGTPEQELEQAMEEGRAVDERWHARKDGSRFWSSGFVRPIRSDAGMLRGFAKVARDITERKRTEDRLRESEEQLRLVTDSAPVLIAYCDSELRYRFVNDAYARRFGLTREDIVGKSIPEVLGEEAYASISGYVDATLGGQSVEFEVEVPFRDIGRYYMRCAYVPEFGERGEVRGLVAVISDITDRKRAEQAQRFLVEAGEVLSSSLDYRETLSSVAQLAVPTLADWCAVDILEEDGSLERLAVAHPDPNKVELAYKLQERYPPDPSAPRGVYHVLRTGEPEMMAEIPEGLIEEAARDEEHREILRELGLRSYMVVPLFARGRTLGAISFVSAESGRRYGEADLQLAQELARRAALAVDNAWLYEEAQKEIVERRWAQEELRRSRDQLEVILKGVADGIVAQDTTGRVIYANEAAATMSGYSSVREFVEAPLEEVMSKFEILDEESNPFPVERLPGRRALSSGESVEEALRFRILRTGEERWSVVRSTPVLDGEGRGRMAVSIMRDITERKRAEEALRARARQQEAVAELGRQALISTDLSALMEETVELVARILGAEYCKVLELLPDGRELLLRAGVGWKEGLVGHATVSAGYDSQAGYTLISDRPVIVEDLRTEGRFSGPPLLHEHGVVSGMSVIIRGRQRPFGVLGAHTEERRSFTDDDINFLRAIANVLAAAIERKRAEDAVREIRELERRRIARDLHDGVLQDLSYTVQAIEVTKLQAQGTGLEPELQQEVDALRSAAQELRIAVQNLRLADELDQPFPELLESLVQRNRGMARDHEIRLEVQEGFPSIPLGEAAVELLRILQEALTNARRHSGARNVMVTLRFEGEELAAEVTDDGRGFGAETALGVGLRSMRERAASLGGTLEVESEPGRGTSVRLRVPMPWRL